MALIPEQFDRSVSVIVGPISGVGKMITELKIAFTVEKSLETNPNPAKISITNLASETRSLVEMKNAAVMLKAGYGDNLKQLFVGDIARVGTQRNGPDIVTTIEAGDGESAYQNRSLDVSFMPGINSGTVFQSVLAAFRLKPGQIIGFNPAQVYQSGLVLTGMAREHMSAVIEKQGLQWSIQDGAIQVLPKGVGTVETAVLISKETGLVGTPFKTTILRPDLLASNPTDAGAKSGVNIRCLLNPEIKPGRYILLKSEFVNGVFRAEKVIHSGDNFSASWYTDIEAK